MIGTRRDKPRGDDGHEQDEDDGDTETPPQPAALQEGHEGVEQIDDDQGERDRGEQDAQRPDEEVEGREDDADDGGERYAEEAPANDPVPDRLGMDDPLPEGGPELGALHIGADCSRRGPRPRAWPFWVVGK